MKRKKAVKAWAFYEPNGDLDLDSLSYARYGVVVWADQAYMGGWDAMKRDGAKIARVSIRVLPTKRALGKGE